MRILVIVTSIIVFSATAGSFITAEFQVPQPLRVKAFSPEDIINQISQEKLQKKYHMAEDVSRHIYAANGCEDEDLIYITARKAVDHNIPARVLSALIFVESSCHSQASSKRYSCGYMQVNSRVWNIPCEDLMDPERGIEEGTKILSSYKKLHGLRGGLHHYLGMGTDDGTISGDDYATKVLTVAGYRHPELVQ